MSSRPVPPFPDPDSLVRVDDGPFVLPTPLREARRTERPLGPGYCELMRSSRPGTQWSWYRS